MNGDKFHLRNYVYGYLLAGKKEINKTLRYEEKEYLPIKHHHGSLIRLREWRTSKLLTLMTIDFDLDTLLMYVNFKLFLPLELAWLNDRKGYDGYATLCDREASFNN